MGWWRQLTALFRSEPVSGELYEKLHEMLVRGRQLFERVTEELLDPDKPGPEREEVYGMDARINQLHSEIRRRLLTSVAVNPERDAATRRLLIGMARDAERCGDFSKNIYEVFEHASGLDLGEHADFLREQRAFVASLFDEVWQVVDQSDEVAANRLIAQAKDFSRRDAAIVHAILAGEPSAHPAAVALLVRFFKRIQHHLVNLAKSVANPAELLPVGGPVTS